MIEALEGVVFIWLFILSCFCVFGVVFLAVILVLAGKGRELKEKAEAKAGIKSDKNSIGHLSQNEVSGLEDD